jgi:DNA-binding NtrC family response regulator
MQRSVLVVDDEANMRLVMQMALEEAGYRVLTADSAESALPLLKDPDIDVILTDLKMPGIGGHKFITRSRQERTDVPIIVVTAYGSIRSAIDCIQAGANNYLTKPFEPEELQFAVDNAVRYRELMQENQRLHAVMQDTWRNRRLIGEGAAMQRLLEQIRQVAPYKTNVLITGESGTGKEAVARSIHELGPRADQPWVALNCSAIPRELMESELFGYVKGAFTGAIQNRLGRLEQAQGGTLFLDEIGDLDPELQSKLLRVLQEREFSPVGSDTIRRVDVRIIAATNRDLGTMVRSNEFREDLYYRLDVYNLQVPPLRERVEDIPLLAQAFLTRLRAEMDKQVTGFDEDALKAMAAYPWPGNVRELRNAIERALLTCQGERITLADLPDKVHATRIDTGAARTTNIDIREAGLDAWLAATERDIIVQALDACDGVQVDAARLLGISERSLWHRVKKFDIRVGRKVKH